MSNLHDIEKKVADTLESIDQISRAKANPFLYTRVKAALSDTNERGWSWLSYLKKPSFALSTVALVLVMNIWVIFNTRETTPGVVQEDEQQFATEYSYAVSTADRFYSLNEEQP